MHYVSLYRKYRSQTFDDVVGQDHVVKTIKNAIRAGRVAHGYLFCGSRGTGKTTVARLIAKALNCMSGSGPTPDPCNRCEACESITNGSAVDVIEMDAASNRGVEDVDALREGVKYPPMRLRYKVYIIDEAHQLSATAKDAFLKTLEEPPSHAVFILATTESGKIPITIRSRCQEFDFRRGTVAEIAGRLRHVIQAEGFSFEDDAVELIARLAAGSYRDALSVLEQVAAYTGGAITARDVYTVVGAVEEDVLLEIGDVVASQDTSAAFDLADRLLREGGDVRELLRSAANHFRDLLALKVGADEQRAENPRWRAQADRYSEDRLLHAIEVFSAAEKDLRYNEQHRLGLEMALLKSMARPITNFQAKGDTPLAASLTKEDTSYSATFANEKDSSVVSLTKGDDRKFESKVGPICMSESGSSVGDASADPASDEYDPFSDESVSPIASQSEPTVEKSGSPVRSVTLIDVQRNWQKVLSYLQRVMRRVSEAALAREGLPVNLNGSLLTIGFDAKHKFHYEKTRENAEKIADAIEQVLGVRFKINTTLITEENGRDPSEVATKTPEPRPVEHPRINDILTVFDGREETDPGPDPWQEE